MVVSPEVVITVPEPDELLLDELVFLRMPDELLLDELLLEELLLERLPPDELLELLEEPFDWKRKSCSIIPPAEFI